MAVLGSLNEDNEEKSPFILAFEKSDKSLVIELINRGVELNNPHDFENGTPLHYAAYKGWVDVVNLLLQKGADTSIATIWGSNALLIACAKGHKDVAEVLSKSSKYVDCVTEDRCTATFDLECYTKDNYNWTALHFAARYGWYEVVKVLAERRANLNIPNSRGQTPLLVAMKFGHIWIVKLLIKQGADPTCSDKYKWTILHYAAKYDVTSLVETIAMKGADLNVKTAKGLTPLILACLRRNMYVVSELVRAGADIEVFDSEKHTVLWFALRRGWMEVIERLADRGVDFDEQLPSGEVPLLMAAEWANRDTKIFHFLVEWGVDVKCIDQNGWTLLHHASLRRWLDIVKSGLERGCDANAVNWSGDTPLHLVCESHSTKMITSECVQIAELLVEEGADVNAKNSHGETPLSLASKCLKDPGIESIELNLFNCLMNAQCKG